MEDVRKCKKRGRRVLSWTSARQVPANISGAEGGGLDPADCAGVGFGAIRAGGFLPVETAGACKPVTGAYFCGRGACAQYDPKVILGAKILDPTGDAYHASKES